MDEIKFEALSLNDNNIFKIGDVIYYNDNYIIITEINDCDFETIHYGINYLNDLNDYFIDANQIKYCNKIELNYNNLMQFLEKTQYNFDEIDVSYISSWNDIFNLL